MYFRLVLKWLLCAGFFLNCSGTLCRAQAMEGRLKITLRCGDFSDKCILIFKASGAERIKDRDALKIGEGYVAVAILDANQQHFSIEERPLLKSHMTHDLFVKGFPSAHYELRMEGMDVLLEDKVEKQLLRIPSGGGVYTFNMDTGNPEGKRFVLHFETLEEKQEVYINQGEILTVYPNPMKDKLTIRFKENPGRDFDVLIRDMSGNLVWQKHFEHADNRNEFLLDCGKQNRGIYFLQIIDAFQRPVSETIKFIQE